MGDHNVHLEHHLIAGMLLFFSTTNTVLQTIVPDDMRGRVMGVWSLIFGAMIPLTSLEAGALVRHFVCARVGHDDLCYVGADYAAGNSPPRSCTQLSD